jgi:hypothetical protein
VTVNGIRDGFAADPGWDAARNRVAYRSANVRP